MERFGDCKRSFAYMNNQNMKKSNEIMKKS